ncbi:MAG: hypothetical protein ABIQ53_03680 [Terracoccus sp.]
MTPTASSRRPRVTGGTSSVVRADEQDRNLALSCQFARCATQDGLGDPRSPGADGDEVVAAGQPVPIESEATEYAPQVIHSVVTGTQRTIQVNVANTGLITNLPYGAAVEVPATVDVQGVHPWYVGDLPPQCAALNRAFLNVGELTVHAAYTEDPRAIRQAVMLDPNAAATLTVTQIWDMCDDLVAAHGDLLPEWARGSRHPSP